MGGGGKHMTSSAMTYEGALKTLLTGNRLSFDDARKTKPFRGLYAWWATADSPQPINPTIPAIKAGECVRVGATGVFGNGKPRTARLRTNCRWLPAHLSCYEAGSRWLAVFPTEREAESWCRRALAVRYWQCPEHWTGLDVQHSEVAVIATLQSYCDRHIQGGRAKDPRCPRCGAVVGYTRTAQKSIAPQPCLQCGWKITI
jgi:predicted RNA-binding Zn-ribbon protein involved in translation (DUF1610 family)